VIVDALACYRLTRLVTRDTLTEPARRVWVESVYSGAGRMLPAVASQDGVTSGEIVSATVDPPTLATLATCDWCASVWIAAGALAIRRFVPKVWEPLAELLAMSAVAGLLAGHEER
jgi:hypothetical protein